MYWADAQVSSLDLPHLTWLKPYVRLPRLTILRRDKTKQALLLSVTKVLAGVALQVRVVVVVVVVVVVGGGGGDGGYGCLQPFDFG